MGKILLFQNEVPLYHEENIIFQKKIALRAAVRPTSQVITSAQTGFVQRHLREFCNS